jgi:vacuolar-type H+-ATPase subunit I/STV1
MMKPRTPGRRAALISLVLFVTALIGYFVPLGGIAGVGPYLKFINQVAVYLLIGGYGLLLAAVYIL